MTGSLTANVGNLGRYNGGLSLGNASQQFGINGNYGYRSDRRDRWQTDDRTIIGATEAESSHVVQDRYSPAPSRSHIMGLGLQWNLLSQGRSADQHPDQRYLARKSAKQSCGQCHTPPGRSISIETQSHSLTVSNAAAGDPLDEKTLFCRFRFTDDRRRGNGLGLPSSRLSVTSTAGRSLTHLPPASIASRLRSVGSKATIIKAGCDDESPRPLLLSLL